MSRQATRSAYFEVKKELEDCNDKPKSSIATVQATAAPPDFVTGGVNGACAGAGASSSRWQTPKVAGETVSSDALRRSKRRTIKKEPKLESGGREHHAPATAGHVTRGRGGDCATATSAPKRRRRGVSDMKEEHEVPDEGTIRNSKKTRRNASNENDAKPTRRRAGAGSTLAAYQQQNKKNEITKAEEEKQKENKVVGRKIPPRLAEKAALIIQVMDILYPNPPIPINHVDSFTLLCGVLLSAQTTDSQVNEVTKELFKVAPDPLSLAKMSQEKVQQIIRSVGLAPTKAKHLIALSQQLLDRFEGRVPDTFEGLQSLPGVGRKTAAVVMVQAFGTPAFPVDTHIHRLALRWGLTKNEKNASKVEQDMMAIFPRDSWAKLHLQFIYFGREHCQARAHEASACPVCCWVKKTGPSAPKALSDLTRLRDYLATPTPPKKSSKNVIMYSERLLEMDQFKMKMEG